MSEKEQGSFSEIVLYQAPDGRTRVECRLDDGTVWLSQALMAELYQRDVRTINEHLINIYEEGELDREATIRKFRIVQTEGNRQVAKLVDPYRREAILSVGCRARSRRGIQFRRWATSKRQEHPCQREAILPIDSRPLPIVDEKTRGLSPRFIRMRSTPVWTASTTRRCSPSATTTRTSRKA